MRFQMYLLHLNVKPSCKRAYLLPCNMLIIRNNLTTTADPANMALLRCAALSNHEVKMSQPAKVLAEGDVRRMLRSIAGSRKGPRDALIVLLSCKAGLRACEIAGLDWSMVLCPAGLVSQSIQVAGSLAKHGRGRRIPIHPELRSALRACHAWEGRPVVGPVVRSQRGGHFTPRGIVNWFAALYGDVGLTGCSSHSGRRTFITNAARLVGKTGGSLRDVQELAGHRALTTTERYIEGDRDAQRKLVRLL
jgi:integrase